jgi:multidrug efflux system membrane fusion protein
VPVTALRHGANGDFVYVLNEQNRTVSLRNVKRGQATAERVQVVSGLEGGETVITEGADRLKDGAKVTLPGDRPAGAGAGGGRRGHAGGAGAAGATAQGEGAPAASQAAPAGDQRQRRRQQEGAAQ